MERVLSLYPGAEIIQEIYGETWNSQTEKWPVDVGLRHNAFPKGVGLRYKNRSNPEITSYHREHAERFKNSFTTIYQSLATEEAMKLLGFEVGAMQTQGNDLVFEGHC